MPVSDAHLIRVSRITYNEISHSWIVAITTTPLKMYWRPSSRSQLYWDQGLIGYDGLCTRSRLNDDVIRGVKLTPLVQVTLDEDRPKKFIEMRERDSIRWSTITTNISHLQSREYKNQERTIPVKTPNARLIVLLRISRTRSTFVVIARKPGYKASLDRSPQFGQACQKASRSQESRFNQM